MKRLLLLLLLTLPAYAQNGSKIVTDANATGQTGAMQTGSRAAAVTFTFCGTGFSGPVYVDAAATSAALAQVWTTTLAGNSDCTTTYAYSPASKWYRVRWTRSAGTLNIWMNIQTGDVTAGAITGPVGGLTAGRVVLTSGATGITDDAGLTYVAATDALTTGAVAAQNLTATGLATPGAITVTPQGTGGVVTWTYKLVATLADGTTTEAGAASSTAVGNANLGAVNFNRLTWSAVPGAAGYKVYRTVTGTTPLTTGIIYTGTALTVDDTGLAGGGETAPTVDGTGVARADRVLVGDGTAAAPSVGFTDNTGIYNIGTSQLGFSAGGSSVAGLNATRLNLNVSGGLSINADTFLYRGAAAATLQLGAANVTGATPPVAQTLTVQSVGTTATADLAGADWTHKGSLGKGTAASGKHIFTVGTPQNTTVAHVASTVLTLQDTGTGGTAAPQALFADGTAAKPSVVVGSANKGFFYSAPYLGLANGDSGNYHRWNGAAYQIPSDVGNVAFGASLDLTLTRGAAATLQLGAAASATPVAQTLQSQGATGTDVAGANLTIRPGAGTGAAAGSTIVFQTPTATGSGTTAQTQVERVRVSQAGLVFSTAPYPIAGDVYNFGVSGFGWQALHLNRATLGSKTKAIVDATPTAFATFTIADGATYTGEVIYKVKAIQGTSLQALAGRARFAATREGSTYTVVVNEVGTQLLAAAAGTLTGAIEISGAAGVVTLSANFNTSLTPTTFTIDARFDSPDAALALTFP